MLIGDKKKINFEHPLTWLVWLTSFLSIGLTFLVSFEVLGDLGNDGNLWWVLSLIISCGTLAGAVIPELIKVFTSTESAHVKEVVTLVPRGRRIAQRAVRPGRGQLQRLLDGDRAHRADGGAPTTSA